MQRLGDLDLTMLHQMSCQACINAVLHDSDGLKELANILEPVGGSMDGTLVPLNPTEVSEILGKAPGLTGTEYDALLCYLQLMGRPY